MAKLLGSLVKVKFSIRQISEMRSSAVSDKSDKSVTSVSVDSL